MLIAISQSGETADTLAALREGKERVRWLGDCKRGRQTIARETGRRDLSARGAGNRRGQHQGVHLPMCGADDAVALPRPAKIHEPGPDAGDDDGLCDSRSDADGSGAKQQIKEIAAEFCGRENWLFSAGDITIRWRWKGH